MPSVSPEQQRLMGQAYAVKTGKKKLEEVDLKYRDKIEKLVKDMTTKELKDFAETKHSDMKENFSLMSFTQFVQEDAHGNVGLNPDMNVPGMGSTTIASQPGLPLPQQIPGSGDMLYVPQEETVLQDKKKKRKRKKRKRTL